MLWGVLAFATRFLPYLGPWIAAAVSILISIATSDGWTQPIIVFAWYLMVELVVYNFIEPFVYGSIVGVSTVGILVAALFWTWLWGPIGLVLAMPMTVCLLVAARYVPQLRFLTILLGDQSPLSPSEHVYQRLLAFDYHEPLKHAQKHLKESSLAGYYDGVLLPALCMAEHDRHDDLLNEDQCAFVIDATEDLVEELGDEAFAAIAAKAESVVHPPVAIASASSDDETVTARVLCIPFATKPMKQRLTCSRSCSLPKALTWLPKGPSLSPAKSSIESPIPKAMSSSYRPCHRSNRATAGCCGNGSATAIPTSPSSLASGPARTTRKHSPRPRTIRLARWRRHSRKQCRWCARWPYNATCRQKPPSARTASGGVYPRCLFPNLE